jgi:hypothetical protein
MKDLKKFIATTIREYLNEQYIENPKDVVNNYTHYKSGDKFYPKSEWAKWFLSQDRNSKEQIAYNIKNDKTFRNALLSNWFDYYKKTVNDNISYDDFLNKEITIYRGETSRDIKYGDANGFASYTPQKDLAKHFSRDGLSKIIELKIKPKNTFGMIDSVGNEIEILIPTKFSEDFMKKQLDNYTNQNIWVFDKLDDIETDEYAKLEDNKNYEDAIDLITSYVTKYKNNR